MQASRQSAQPVQCSGSITGRAPPSQLNAPGTGQESAQAPHSGPEYGRQFVWAILAEANFGEAGGRSSSSSGSLRASGSQAVTQGQSVHIWQPCRSRSIAGVPAAVRPSLGDSANKTSCGQAAMHASHRVQLNRNSNSSRAKGGRIQRSARFAVFAAARCEVNSVIFVPPNRKKSRRPIDAVTPCFHRHEGCEFSRSSSAGVG